jgi:hypothetical protein
LKDADCRSFIGRLIKTFPGFDEPVKHLDDKAKRETYRGWAEAWRDDIALDECNAALDQLAIDGGITQTNYREPGPFIRRLVMERRSKERQVQNQRNNYNQRLQRLESARQLRDEYKQSGRSISEAYKQAKSGVPLGEVIENA